jgi:hypothetical protein
MTMKAGIRLRTILLATSAGARAGAFAFVALSGERAAELAKTWVGDRRQLQVSKL